ncbi:hypothetical protein TNCV_1228651 [Trichonephila clavipes]|nr:hypothetical protein TNCV_1228651 [Trichonephila clavipes]
MSCNMVLRSRYQVWSRIIIQQQKASSEKPRPFIESRLSISTGYHSTFATYSKSLKLIAQVIHWSTKWYSGADCLVSNPRDGMNVRKCIAPSRHGGTLKSRRTASPLVRLGEGEDRWRPPRCSPSSNNLALSHDEYRGALI